MRYSDDIIEEVRSRSDIVDVVSQYVKLTRKGSSYFGLCPFHNEKTPSFSVTPGKQMYYCFGCGAGGNVFTFLMEYENYSFVEALEHLAERAGVELPKAEYSKEAKALADRKLALLEIHKQAAKYYYYLLRNARGERALSYLENRKITRETMQKFGLGYADQSGVSLYQYLKSHDYSDELLRESGLFLADEKRGMHDKFWNRVIFPIMDVNHRVIGFGGRVMGDGKPKYLNSPETKIFDKSRNLYGLYAARSTRENYLILCEGYMDVISMHQAGFTNAVASLGTALTAGHANLLKRYTKEVLLLYDSDEAGIKAALRGIPILKEAGISARVVDLAPCKDPDEFLKARGREAFKERLAKAQNSFMYQIGILRKSYHLDDPQDKTAFFQEIALRLLEFSDELERNNYIEALAGKYQVAEGDLKKMVGRLAMEGRQPKRDAQVLKPFREKKRLPQESGTQKAQKLLLTWLVTYPQIFEMVENYISPEDFTCELYRQVAEILYQQHKSQAMNPAGLLNRFMDSEEEQREVASMFHATIHLETQKEQEKAFRDTVMHIKKDKLAWEDAHRDPEDIQGLQEGFQKKKELEELERRLRRQSISFQ